MYKIIINMNSNDKMIYVQKSRHQGDFFILTRLFNLTHFY